MSSYREMDASLQLRFALSCYSNATRAPIANPPNNAQLGDSLYHAPKLHPGPCSTVGVRSRTDRQTDTHRQTRVATIHFASSTTHAKCNEPYLPLTPSRSVAALWLVLISRLAEGRRLSWPGWLVEIPRWFDRPKTVIHPSVCRGGRELNPRPSSRDSNALTTRLPSNRRVKNCSDSVDG